MGLFSNNKKLCPICGNPTPRFLAAVLNDNIPICKDCAEKVDLPDGALGQMSVDDFKKYLDFYAQNEPLRNEFTETYRFDFGFMKGSILLDEGNRLFRLKDTEGAIVLEAAHLKSFCISEDKIPLFEGSQNRLLCHKSDVPMRVKALQPRFTEFELRKQEYEFMERQKRLGQNDSSSPKMDIPEPTLDVPAPVDKFYIDFVIEHPYWGDIHKKIGAPTFSTYDPSIAGYLSDYNDKVDELRQLADCLMRVINPDAAVVDEGEETMTSTPVAQVSTADEIMKYKNLLDAGAITEEEFAAKKKQLLGI